MAVDILGNGWNISEQGEEIITESKTVKDKSTLLKNALNSDLKEIGSPVLSKIINKGNVSQVVLQIQKIRNIAAPKANESSQAAPRMLKLVLTDGDSYIQAIETAPIPVLNHEKTPPGSKLLIHSAKISSGYLLLDSTNCSLLGGQVPALYEKWQLAKSVQYHNRQTSSTDGPPAWVNFGCKIQASQPQDRNFKSLENKVPEVKENSKFDMQRQDAIAEAATGAVKKVFGGGVKQTSAFNQIPKKLENNVSRERRAVKATKNVGGVKEAEEKPQKPCERVSLFEFLEDKLPSNETVTNPAHDDVKCNVNLSNPSTQQNNRNKSNNYLPRPTSNRFESNQNKFKKDEKSYTTQNKDAAHNDVNNLSNNFGKMALNSQFASRSLRQHLNLNLKRYDADNNNPGNNINWKVGDDCMAKYWEDGKFYNAIITAVTDRTCVVQFKGYGNIEEVLKVDCFPKIEHESNKKTHAGPVEFKRNTRVYRRQ